MNLGCWLANQLLQENNGVIKDIIAVYPGRFQPFGPHHAKAFEWLQGQFGAQNTYILTSNVTDATKSPLTFKDKQSIINQYGIRNVVNVKAPYAPAEFLNKFNHA